MKQKIQLLYICIFWIAFSLTTEAQQNEMKQLEVKSSISIDSVENIKIDKVVYYAKPLEFKLFSITDTTYIPIWYKTFCANSNINYFNDYSKDAIHYISKESGYTESDLKKMYDIIINSGGMQEFYKEFPERKFMYIFDEIWLTAKHTNTKYLIIQGFYSDKQLEHLSLSHEISEKNLKIEKIDSIKNLIQTSMIFVEENDTLKWNDQLKTFDNIVLNDKHTINPDLNTFKDMIYKKSKYIQSEMENGKRIFKTMEKTGNTFKVVKVSNKPE